MAYQDEKKIIKSDAQRAAEKAKAEAEKAEQELRATRAKLESQLAQSQSAQGQLSSDLVAGMEQANKLIPEGSSGRVDESRSADVADIIARRREALSGLTSEEAMAKRELAIQNINRQTETTRRRLASIQAAQGLRGGVAAAGQLAALQEGAQQRSNFERQMIIEDAAMKRDALSAFEQSVTAAEADERSRRLFNIKAKAQEQAGRLQFSVGFGQILSAERSARYAAEQQAAAQRASASAASGCFPEFTKVKTVNGWKKIGDIKIGDELSGGNIVYSLMVVAAPENDMFEYDGTIVSGSHAVYENEEWKRVRDADNAKKIDWNGLLYNLGVSKHWLHIGETIFSDMDEFDIDDNLEDRYLELLNTSKEIA